MPEKLIMVRESEWREMREALAKCADGWGNAVELDLLPSSHHAAATYLRDEARRALSHPTPDGCGREGKQPRVKKLEWRPHGPQGIAADFESFTYAIYRRPAGLCDLFFGHTDEETLALGVSEQEAKAAAQADFERRILSALEGGDDG